MIWRFLCLCLLFQDAFTIDFDYYFSSPTRSHLDEVICDLPHKLSCQVRCRTSSAMCISNKCYCVSVRLLLEPDILPDASPEEFNHMADETNAEIYGDDASLEEFNHMADETNAELYGNVPQLESSISDQNPSLRHHIAHFCPNLELARQCIRKCMKTGKPAFCGKDHVCYCGHKYSDHDDNTKIDPKATYSMFKDMYKKYFGADDDDDDDVSGSMDTDTKKPSKFK